MTLSTLPTDMPGSRNTAVPHLTGRQETVLCGLLLARTNQEMAIELNLSEYTIKYHCRSLFRRYGVTNRVELFSLYVCQPARFPKHVVAQVAAQAARRH